MYSATDDGCVRRPLVCHRTRNWIMTYDINSGNLLGVVLPEEFKRAEPLRDEAQTLSGVRLNLAEFLPTSH